MPVTAIAIFTTVPPNPPGGHEQSLNKDCSERLVCRLVSPEVPQNLHENVNRFDYELHCSYLLFEFVPFEGAGTIAARRCQCNGRAIPDDG